MAATATTHKIQFQFSAAGTNASATAGNGVLIFDSANRKIYARGTEWVSFPGHAANTFGVFTNNEQVTSFNQISDTSINFANGTNTTVTKSGNTITISSTDSKVDSAVNHYSPTENNDSSLNVNSGSSLTFNESFVVTGIKRDAKGHITGLVGGKLPAVSNFTLSKATKDALGGIKVSNVLSSAQTLTSGNGTTSGRYYGVQIDSNGVAFVNVPWETVNTNSLQFGANNGTKTNVYTGNQSSNTGVSFNNGGNVTISWDGTNKAFTLGVASGYSIPSDSSLNNFQSAYNWYNTTVATTEDTDNAINKWNEIVNFLAGVAEDSSIGSLLAGKANSSHAHGDITTDGKIGTTANLPLITSTGGKITVGSFGNTANTFCQGNDARLSDARTPVAHAVNADTYGLGTTSVYGHVKIVDGDLNGKTNANGLVASQSHTHSQYISSLAKDSSATATATLSHSGTFSVITDFTVSGNKIKPTVKTFTLPASGNTDNTALTNGTKTVSVASSTGIKITGGTNKFTVGEGTNAFDVTITPDLTGYSKLTSVTYDSTNKKLTKTINGSTTDIVSASTIVTDGGAALATTVNESIYWYDI